MAMGIAASLLLVAWVPTARRQAHPCPSVEMDTCRPMIQTERDNIANVVGGISWKSTSQCNQVKQWVDAMLLSDNWNFMTTSGNMTGYHQTWISGGPDDVYIKSGMSTAEIVATLLHEGTHHEMDPYDDGHPEAYNNESCAEGIMW